MKREVKKKRKTEGCLHFCPFIGSSLSDDVMDSQSERRDWIGATDAAFLAGKEETRINLMSFSSTPNKTG